MTNAFPGMMLGSDDMSNAQQPSQQPEEVQQQRIASLLAHGKNTLKRVGRILYEDTATETFFSSPRMRWIIPLVCITLLMFAAIFFRLYPYYLVSAEKLATGVMTEAHEKAALQQVKKDFPALSNEQQQQLVRQILAELYRDHPEKVQEKYLTLVNDFKAHLQDENNVTYLLANDPYLWYKETKNYLTYGHLGDKLVTRDHWFSFEDGLLGRTRSVNSLRNGREGVVVNIQLHPILGAYWHRLIQLFDRDIPLEKTFFLLPIAVMALSMIPLFFLARKIAGNLGGLVAGIVLATNISLLDRTMGGFSDTDPYSIFFPLLISWVFVEMWERPSRKRFIFAAILGVLCGVYAIAWSGWWYTLGLILATIFFVLVYQTIHRFVREKNFSVDWREWKTQSIVMGIILFTTGIASTIFKQNMYIFPKLFAGPFQFLQLKETTISLWPRVFGTVSELQGAELSQIIPKMGGWLLVFLALAGLFFTILLKNQRGERQVAYTIFFSLWLAVTTYAFTKGVRFSILMVPAFSVLVGVCVKTLYTETGEKAKKYFSIPPKYAQVVIIILLIVVSNSLFITADYSSRRNIPGMTDAFYANLQAIKNDSSDGIVTTWWDFGHFFTAIAERRVTFDGGDQGERVYWVGRILLTDNEKEALGILRMLNCGQEQAPHILEKYLGGDTVKAVGLTHDIILLTKEEAQKRLEIEELSENAVTEVLNTTHCENLLPQYVVTTPDMMGKSVSWTYFGSWNFARARMYQELSQLSREEALAMLINSFNSTGGNVTQVYQDILTKKDLFITNNFRYYTIPQHCAQTGKRLACPIPVDGVPNGADLIVDLDTMDAYFMVPGGQQIPPAMIVYLSSDGGNLVQKKFGGIGTRAAAILKKKGNDNYEIILADPPLAVSMFTRLYFLNGEGLACLKMLDQQNDAAILGGVITTWKVDWDCAQNMLSSQKDILKDANN